MMHVAGGQRPPGAAPPQPAPDAWGRLGGPHSSGLSPHPQGALPSQGLTLHAQPVRAVLGVEQGPAAVPASVLGRGRHALSAAPVGTLGAARRPLAPLRPRSVDCGSTAHSTWDTARFRTHVPARYGRRGSQAQAQPPPATGPRASAAGGAGWAGRTHAHTVPHTDAAQGTHRDSNPRQTHKNIRAGTKPGMQGTHGRGRAG